MADHRRYGDRRAHGVAAMGTSARHRRHRPVRRCREVARTHLHPLRGSYGFGRDRITTGWFKTSLRALDLQTSRPFDPAPTFEHRQPLAPGQVVPVDMALGPSATLFKAEKHCGWSSLDGGCGRQTCSPGNPGRLPARPERQMQPALGTNTPGPSPPAHHRLTERWHSRDRRKVTHLLRRRYSSPLPSCSCAATTCACFRRSGVLPALGRSWPDGRSGSRGSRSGCPRPRRYVRSGGAGRFCRYLERRPLPERAARQYVGRQPASQTPSCVRAALMSAWRITAAGSPRW
jgi:hypothetical protein